MCSNDYGDSTHMVRMSFFFQNALGLALYRFTYKIYIFMIFVVNPSSNYSYYYILRHSLSLLLFYCYFTRTIIQRALCTYRHQNSSHIHFPLCLSPTTHTATTRDGAADRTCMLSFILRSANCYSMRAALYFCDTKTAAFLL